MADAIKPGFYADAQLGAAQFVYRRLAKSVQDHPQTRRAALDFAIRELAGADPDLRRIKFFAPAFLRRILQPQELAELEAATGAGPPPGRPPEDGLSALQRRIQPGSGIHGLGARLQRRPAGPVRRAVLHHRLLFRREHHPVPGRQRDRGEDLRARRRPQLADLQRLPVRRPAAAPGREAEGRGGGPAPALPADRRGRRPARGGLQARDDQPPRRAAR